MEKDKIILRKLAEQIATIAALPVQEEKRKLWRKLNGLRPERPMVTIDQVCWNEMNIDGKLDLQCEDRECRGYEQYFRRVLLQWEYFPVDMVVEPFIRVGKAVNNSGFGIELKEQTVITEGKEAIMSHKFENQFNSIDDVEKIKIPIITHDKTETRRKMEKATWLFEGIMPLREEGFHPYLAIWDLIARWMSVEEALYGLIDKPEMMHAIMKRMVECCMSMLDQLEEQGVLCHSQSLTHCGGAYTDELPAPGFNPEKPRTKDIWMDGRAQMFSTVSPAMFEEYEVNYLKPIFQRFGLVYYGCCDPLDDRMNVVRKIPNCRKVSMSPWANKERGAEGIGNDFVYSAKPNPAYVATTIFDADLVKKDLTETVNICKKNNCPVEIILKDISTVNHQPLRLRDWGKIAMEIVQK